MTFTRTFLLFTTAITAGWATEQSPELEAYAKLPLHFEANRGQTDRQVKYVARGLGYTTFLTASEAIFSFSGSPPSVVRMKLGGASPVEPVGLDELAGKSNYFIGNDPRKWRTGIANFGRVQYKGVYPGIDLVYHGNQKQLEYDFVIAPGAEPSAIRLQVTGARRMHIDSAGDLVLTAAGQDIRFHKPFVYQPGDGGTQREIEGRYILHGAEIAFEVGRYDPAKPLVIDPLLRSTFLGGFGNDLGYAIAVDQAGVTYVTGSTASVNFPLLACARCLPGGGGSDAFVTAFAPPGNGFIYSTFLGGGGTDIGKGIAVPRMAPGGPQPVFVTGSTNGGFPLMNPVQPAYGGGASDAFVTSLNPAGRPVYSTYLGGLGQDSGNGISVDSRMNAFITGDTNSINFPRFKCLQCALGGGRDAFVTALPPAGRPFLYSTYLGGTRDDAGYGISADDLNDVAITGSTRSLNYPVVAPCAQCGLGGGTDAFISFLNFTPGPPPQPGPPVLTWSTYWGGSGNDVGYGIDIDNFGAGWITGSTTNNTFPVRSCTQCVYGGGPSDAILVYFERVPLVIFSDFVGGLGADAGYGVAATNFGTAYFTGSTNSPNFPMTGCFQCALGGGTDAFVAEYTPAVRLFSSFLGGFADDAGRGIAFNPRNAWAYVAGSTSSPNFTIVPPCTQCAVPGGPSDAFVAVVR